MGVRKVSILVLFLFAFVFSKGEGLLKAQTSKPNIIIIFADDMGYGDIGSFGHPTINTPNLDEMSYQGQKWTQFYVAASVCTPSRAGLVTGRLPIRSGMCDKGYQNTVIFPNSTGGLPKTEFTIASALKEGGYSTACIGKWHLGDDKQFLPTAHGFDTYFGIPYSNDMDQICKGEDYVQMCRIPMKGCFNPPLLRQEEIVERPANQATLTKRYTQEAIDIIEQSNDDPFFIYLAYAMPHVPLFPSADFEGKSARGTYGDVIEELDWSVGEIMKSVKEKGIESSTIVVFTSDNGPWELMETDGGSAGLLRGGKGTIYEGGMRVPTIFWSPGLIPTGVVRDLGSTLDFLPTFSKLAGVDLPRDRLYDGYDISPVLFNLEESPRSEVYYYSGSVLYAVRSGAYKAHFAKDSSKGEDLEMPELYNLDVDPSEEYNIAKDNPDVIARLRALRDEKIASIKPVENQLSKPYKK